MSNVVDLAEERRKRRPTHHPLPDSFGGPSEVMAAMREALDTLAAACVAARQFWPTSDIEWGAVVRAGLKNRLQRFGGCS